AVGEVRRGSPARIAHHTPLDDQCVGVGGVAQQIESPEPGRHARELEIPCRKVKQLHIVAPSEVYVDPRCMETCDVLLGGRDRGNGMREWIACYERTVWVGLDTDVRIDAI